MRKMKSPVSQRAWRILRLALLWARKGGALRRSLMVELRVLPNYIKSLRHVHPRESIHYREKEFSFDETPLFNFKMHRPSSLRFNLPCIKPQVDFDYDYEYEYDFNGGYANEDEVKDSVYQIEGRKSYEEEDCGEEDERMNNEIVPVVAEDESIDVKAEEFIANFYRQMKMQRQVSYLQYHDMLNRGAN